MNYNKSTNKLNRNQKFFYSVFGGVGWVGGFGITTIITVDNENHSMEITVPGPGVPLFLRLIQDTQYIKHHDQS